MNDFCVAGVVAPTNSRYSQYVYINSTLEALNIEPGNFCDMYGEKMTNNIQNDKLRKSSLAYIWGRANACRQNSVQHKLKKKKKKKTEKKNKERKRSKRAKNRNWTEPRPEHHACKYTERN